MNLLNSLDLPSVRLLLIGAVVSLTIIGLVMVYSVTSADLASDGENPLSDVAMQAAYALIGFALLVLVWRAIPYRAWLTDLFWVFYGISIMLILATIFFGTEINGAKRWLYVGPVGIQPSEFVKIMLLMASVRIMYRMQEGEVLRRAGVFQLLALVGAPLVVMYLTQSDLGTTLICSIGIFAVLWLGGIPTKWMIGIGVTGLALVLIAIVGVGYRSSRFVYINPWDDGQNGLGDGYNIIRAYYAISEGGLLGLGIGNSHEKYSYLFASESDFIFAVLCEEMGLIGAMVVIALFLCVLLCGLRIAYASTDDFGRMLAGAFTIMLVFQAFLNMGCAIGVFPTTGKPLPFISSGGSSILSSLIIIGLVLSVERGVELDGDHDRARRNLRVVMTGAGRTEIGSSQGRGARRSGRTGDLGSSGKFGGSGYGSGGKDRTSSSLGRGERRSDSLGGKPKGKGPGGRRGR